MVGNHNAQTLRLAAGNRRDAGREGIGRGDHIFRRSNSNAERRCRAGDAKHAVLHAPHRGFPGGGGTGITLTEDQAAEPPKGLVEVIASELLSAAAQADVVGQETPFTGKPVPAATALQAPEPPPGLVEVSICPALPVTQSAREGQEMPLRPPSPPGAPTRLHAAAPPVGLLEVTICPVLSTATQKETLGQETPRRSTGAASSLTAQADASPVGSVEVITFLP